MPGPDNISKLYNELRDTYDVGSEDEFRDYLSDSGNREALRKDLEGDYDVGDSASFSSYLGFDGGGNDVPAKETSVASQARYVADVRARQAEASAAHGSGGKVDAAKESAVPSGGGAATVMRQKETAVPSGGGGIGSARAGEGGRAGYRVNGIDIGNDESLRKYVSEHPLGSVRFVMEHGGRLQEFGSADELIAAVERRDSESRYSDMGKYADDLLARYDPDNAAATVWQEAEDKSNEEFGRYLEERGKPSLANALHDMADASNVTGGLGADNVDTGIQAFATHLKYHDLQRMADDAWNMLGKEKQQSVIDGIMYGLRWYNPDADEAALREQASVLARQRSDRRVFELAVAKNAPQNATDYFFRKVLSQNALFSLMQAAARSQAGTTGDWEAREDAEQRFENQGHKVAGIAGTVAGFALDPLTWASAGAGGAAVKGITWLGGKMIGEAAMRKFGTTLGGRMLGGAIGGAVNFGTYEAGSEALDQMKWGGYIDDETGERKDGFSLGRVAGRAEHGLMMGAATGVIAPYLGNVSDKLVRATESTVGKMGVRVGELGVSTVAEGTIFSIPEWIDGDRDAWDVWKDNELMMLGFGAQHLIRHSAPRVISQMWGKQANPRAGLETRFRQVLDGNPDLALTKDEQRELDRNGYGDVLELVADKELVDEINERKAASTELVRHGEVADGGEALVSHLQEMLQDNNISEAARAKMYYLATGRRLPMSTVMGSSVTEENGGYTVQSIGANGVITSRTFDSQKKAEAELQRINRQAELNGFDVGERYYDWQGDNKRMYEACESVAEETGAPANLLFDLMKRKTEAMNEVELEWAEKILNAYNGLGDKYGSSEVRAAINDEFGIDVDKAIRKERNRRSEQEQKAVDEYANRLFADVKRKQEEAAERGEAPVDPDAPTSNSQIAALLGIDDGEQGDPVSAAFNRGHEADAQERQDIAIELTDANNAEAQEAWNGVVQRINEDAAYMVAQQREQTKQMQHTDGSLRSATLKEKDSEGNDQQVYIVDGNVQMTPDGSMVDKASSDNIVVVYNPATGERKQIDPTSDTGISSLGEVTTAEQREADIERSRQEYVQSQIDEAQGTVHLMPGQQLVLPTGEEAVVVATDADGENITVALGDGTQATVQRSELQRIRDEKAMADYRQRHGYSNKKETVAKTEPQQPNNAVSTGSSLSADEVSGITSTEPNGEPTVSAGKGSENSATVQEKTEKSAESQISTREWNGHKVGDRYLSPNGDGETAEIIGFDYTHAGENGMPEVLLRGYDKDGNLLGTEAVPPLVFEDNVRDLQKLEAEPNAVQAALAAAEQETNTEPTEAQKEAGNYKKGHVKIDGYDVTIENPKGSVRRGTDASGKQWEQEMQNTYGYIRGTEGVDGDHIDVFFSEDPSQGDVFVVDQVNKDGSFDEHKVMYGFPDIESARKAYLSNYEDGWQGLGAITPVSKEEFKKWIDSSHRKTKPFAEYSSVKPLGDTQLGEQPNKATIKEGEDYVDAAVRIAKENEVKQTAAHFPMETREEAAVFDKRVPEMSDEELLTYMQEDGKGDVNKAHHPSVYDEYDYRHGDEQLQSYDATLVRLNESGTTLEQAEEMLANLQKDVPRFATEDRAELLGQEEALQEYIAGLENRKEEKDEVAAVPQHTEQTSEENDDAAPELTTEEGSRLSGLRSKYPDRVFGEQHEDGSVTFHDEDALLVSELLGREFDGEDLTLAKEDADKALQKLLANGHKVGFYGDEYKPKYDEHGNRIEQMPEETEPQPVGKGAFGNIYDQFRGKAKEAIAFLLQKKEGEATGALHHKDIGEIDLVWGEEGTGKSDGFGLAKLVKYHPEVLDNLQEILDDMHVVQRSENRVRLESDTHQAAVRLTWDSQKKNWLLTAFEKKNSALDNTTDTGKTSERGKRNDTATPQSTVSEGKVTDLFGNEQGKGKKSSADAKIDDVGERLEGARKDMRRKIAESLANVTEAALIEKPFGKVYKKPDLKKAVESGALREKDAIFYEALFSMINQQKPKVTQSEMRSKRYIPDYKTKAERWASSTYKAIETLRQFMEADEAQRDALIDAAMNDRYPNREKELAEIEQRKRWNPDREDHKYEWGDKTTPNPLWVTYEVMNRMGYNVGDKLDIPFGVVEANTSGTGYSIKNLKGERASLFGSSMSIDEAIDAIVYLARLKRGDADISHPTQLFAFPATKSEMGESGRYRVMWGRDYKTREFDSKEEADAFAATKSGAYVSPINEVKRRFGYKVRFYHPLTGEKMFVDDAEFDTKDEAQAYFDGNFEKLNDATNAKLEAERSKKGEKKTLTADDVVHVQMVHSKDGGWKYAVLIDKKYANNDGMPYIIKEGFANSKDAKDFADSIKDDALKTVLKHKEDKKKVVYFDTGENSRIGEDYRNGKDVDARDVAQSMDDNNGTEVVRFIDFLRRGALEQGESRYFHVGETGDILNEHGISGKITIGTSAVNSHHNEDADHLDENDWVEVIEKINEPVAITEYGDKGNSYRIYTIVEKNGKNICVGVDVNSVGRDVNITNIRTAFARDIANALNERLVYPHSRTELETAIRELSLRHNREVYPEQPYDAANIRNNSDIDKENGENVTEDTAKYRIREDEPPTKTGIGYKVFVLKDGKLYPPMVANPNGEATPVGVWLDADAAPVAGVTKTGRQQVKAGGKGTQGGSGKLAYRPGWHLGEIPYALQFNRMNPETGQRELFPANFVWAEVEYANDVDYQEEAMSYGMNASGKFQHSLAGLPRLPENGSYRYRTNPDPNTDPWVITGAMKVNRILKPSEVDAMVEAAGREPQQRQAGAITDEQVEALNANVKRTMQEDRDMMRSVVQQMGEKLHTDINIIEDVNEITHPNAAVQERRRKSKGWYDTATGQVNIVLDNNKNIDDVKASVGHETIAHKGLRELVGEENYDEFLDETYQHLRDDLKKGVDAAAGRAFIDDTTKNGKRAKSYDHHRRTAVDELFGRMAEKPFEEFSEGERTLWQKIKATVRRLLDKFLGSLKLPKWFELGDNELRYILWRSKERLERGREHPIDLARDIVKREELGLGEDNTLYSETKKDAHPTRLQTSDDAQAVQRDKHLPGTKVEINSENREEIDKNLSSLAKKVAENQLPAEEFLAELRKSMKTESEDHSGYNTQIVDGELLTMRISDHHANAKYSKRNGEFKVVSVVIKTPYSNNRFRPHKEVEMVEYTFDADKLTHDNEQNIVAGIQQWMETGQCDIEGAITVRRSPRPDAEDTAVYRDPDETEDIWNDQSMGLQERITAAATRLANNHRDNKTLRNDAMRAIGGNLSDLRKAMSLQRTFDMTTVKRVADLARVLMNNGYLNGLTQQEVKRLLAAVKNSVGHNDIEGDVQKVMDIMVDNQLKNAKAALESLEAIRGSKVDARGVEVQGQLDPAGQVMLEAFKDGRRLTREALEEEIGKVPDRMSSESESVRADAENAYAGLQFALQYADRIADSEHEEKVLRDELKQKHDKTSERDRATDSYRQYVSATEDAIRQNKIERAQAYHDLVAAMTDGLRESVANAQKFKENERRRVQDIHHFANSDMQGMELRGHRPDSRLDRWNENCLLRFGLSPLHTFDQFMRLFGRKNADGKGYLYDHYVRKYIDSADHEQIMKEKYEGKLEAKVKELFGTHKVAGGLRKVPYTYTSLYGYVDALPMMKVTYYDGAGKREYELSQAQLAYLYMVDKMPMGKATNRGMGVTEEVIEQIESSLDAKMKEFVDWVQEEFLVELGNECNEVHKRMFGANMANIEHYFPFVRDKNAIKREVENGGGESMAERISTKTGAIIKRTPSVANWDMPNANFLDVLAKHVSEMCQWSSYAELNRDLGTLQSFNRFKQQVLDMRTIYGSGEQLWKRFMQTCAIAGNAYEPKRGEADKLMVQGAKGVVMGKIAFRPMTAMKQLLSLPAFFGEVDMECLSRDFATGGIASVKWAWENMPNFRKRIKSRTMGDFRLSATKYDKEKGWTNTLMRISAYGMLPNIGVDAWTIALGSHAVYVKAKKKYLRQGYSEEKAERRAVQDAELCFNKSQQSSEGAFMAPVQIDHTFASTTMMLFRNASTSYTRECVTSVRNLKRMMSGEVDVDFMAKQILRNAEIPTFSMLFDAELQRQVEGTLPVGHIYSLGMPGGVLQSAGFPDAPIELSSTRLAEKSSDPGHPFPIEALEGLVDALNNPVAVFKYGNNAMNVIVGLEYKGKHFLVGVHFNQQHRGTSVSDIRGLFPKDNAEWLNWISQGKARYLDHKRIKALIAQQRINLAEVDYLDLKDVAKVMKTFINPVIPEQKYFAGWRAEDVERAREQARKDYRSGYVRNSVNAVMFGYILPWLWRIGGLSILLTLGGGDDDKEAEVSKSTKQSLFGPLEGLAYGDVLAEGLYVGANKLLGDGTEKWSYVGRTNPFVSDLAGVLRKLDGDKMAAVNDVLNILVGMKTGVNLQTVSDWATAILDYSPDGNTSREVSLLVSRLLNAPQSQIEKIYFDEIGMSGDEALSQSPRELVERYAQYKVKREHFVTPWVWGDEALLDKKRKKGKTIVKERTEQMGDPKVNEAYLQHEEVYKAIDAKVKAAKKMLKTDYVEAAQMMADAQSNQKDFTTYQLFKQMDGTLDKIVKFYLGSKSSDEAALCQKTMLDYKAAMVNALNATDAEERANAMQSLGLLMQDFTQKYSAMQPNR